MRAFELLSENYRYVGNCVGLNANDLHDMMDRAKQITYGTFVKAVGLDTLRSLFADFAWGQQRDNVRMKNDGNVSYYRSVYKGMPCYYVRESGVEYIFAKGDPKEPGAEIEVKPNRFSILADGALIKGHKPQATFYGQKSPTSLEIHSSTSPNAKAAMTLLRMIRQSKLETVTFADDEEPAVETMRWLKTFL